MAAHFSEGIFSIELRLTIEKIWQTIENVSKISILDLHMPYLEMTQKAYYCHFMRSFVRPLSR